MGLLMLMPMQCNLEYVVGITNRKLPTPPYIVREIGNMDPDRFTDLFSSRLQGNLNRITIISCRSQRPCSLRQVTCPPHLMMCPGSGGPQLC